MFNDTTCALSHMVNMNVNSLCLMWHRNGAEKLVHFSMFDHIHCNGTIVLTFIMFTLPTCGSLLEILSGLYFTSQ